MISALQKRILAGLIVSLTVCGLGYFFWDQITYQNQLGELNSFCMTLQIDWTLDQVQNATDAKPPMRMILMARDPEGNQMGSVYFAGSGRWACNISFSRGRLTHRTYGAGNFAPESGAPKEKLKPW